MSDIFSPVKNASSSRTTSSVFQTTMRSSYDLGFLGDMSRAGPGRGMSIGNMSTHISSLPCQRTPRGCQKSLTKEMSSFFVYRVFNSKQFVLQYQSAQNTKENDGDEVRRKMTTREIMKETGGADNRRCASVRRRMMEAKRKMEAFY
uniref:Uncharacterized protein n=1 Tax=Timema poppense TaxID=170557 RepID=A0A7R9CZP0_TIMPO|nr:unnamed protein product [Timema poppensis]